VGHLLSDFFVAHPRIFLNAMMSAHDEWISWLAYLPHHTLTVWQEGGRGEVEALQQEMIETASLYANEHGYSEIAGKLLVELKSNDIREID